MKRYFGTDGVRGVAGEAPLDRATVLALGVALGRDLASRNRAPRVVMGEDTRESSAWIAATLTAGLQQAGASVEHAGVVPTPAVAYLATRGGFAAGVMVSASHNPYQDNGIKVFGHTGYKLPDEEEAAIERSLEAILEAGGAGAIEPADLQRRPELRQSYLDHLARQFEDVPWGGMRVVVDCAHGAASTVAPELFQRLGFEATVMAASPDGRNINAGVGALHPEQLAAEVRRRGAAAGLALDGDADRAILVDARGEVVNGDAVLMMSARDLQSTTGLRPPVVVGTVMTNFGLERAFTALGIQLMRAAVGDKYVLEKMLEHGAVLGGEPSGHVIFGAEATTGDGLLTALHCFSLMARRQQPLEQLCDGWQQLPQRLINVPVAEKLPFEQMPSVQNAIEQAEAQLRGRGRVLVRYSGTEKLARVMVEAESAAEVEALAQGIAGELRAEAGKSG